MGLAQIFWHCHGLGNFTQLDYWKWVAKSNLDSLFNFNHALHSRKGIDIWCFEIKYLVLENEKTYFSLKSKLIEHQFEHQRVQISLKLCLPLKCNSSFSTELVNFKWNSWGSNVLWFGYGFFGSNLVMVCEFWVTIWLWSYYLVYPCFGGALHHVSFMFWIHCDEPLGLLSCVEHIEPCQFSI